MGVDGRKDGVGPVLLSRLQVQHTDGLGRKAFSSSYIFLILRGSQVHYGKQLGRPHGLLWSRKDVFRGGDVFRKNVLLLLAMRSLVAGALGVVLGWGQVTGETKE